MTEQENQKEIQQEYLDFVEAALARRIEALNEELLEGGKEVESMHDYYWENYTEMDEYGYENYDNQQALLSRVNSNNAALDLKRRFRKMQDSPYFGRVDFVYEGEEIPESHYIGIGNFSERDGGMPLVFDWRAPVSGLFYDFEKGPASYEAPRGMIDGEVASKWQYKIRGGRMIYAVESDFKIDDDILQEELSGNGDVKLKNIVRTIQKEQNQIIRNTKDKILVVQGAAGSGKTSIALHRIAYLLYHDRKHLKASEILILSPNRVFSNYISHILPELGEENIREMSFDYFAWKELKGIAVDCEDCYDKLEQILAGKAKASAYDKRSREFIREMEGFLLMQEDELVTFKDISYKKLLSKSAEELTKLFYFKFLDLPLFCRMDAVMEYVVDEAETLIGRDFTEDEMVIIREKFDRMYETKDIYRIYNRFLEQMGLETLPDVDVKNRMVPYDDVYPMLYMKYRLEGVGSRRRVRHLVIDEMQDYSYVQYLILSKLFPCKMTIVGDRCQTMGEQQQDVMKFLPSVLGKDIRMLSINKSYRNTAEIAEYAQKLIGEDSVENLGRHGMEPQLVSVNDRVEGMQFICDCVKLEGFVQGVKDGRRFETCGVICMDMDEARSVYECLGKLLYERGVDVKDRLMLVDKYSEEFRTGIVVTTFYLAKGLEFDQVFVWSAKGQDAPVYRQAKYIGATRALHELYMLECQGDRA